MPNIGTVMKGEISRLARKEVRAEVESLRKASAAYRSDIAALKRQVAELEKQLKRAAKASSPAPVKEEPKARVRFSASGLKSLRAKLGLSAADMGKLAGVSGQSIYHWEQGKSVPRQAQVLKLAALRGLGKKQANAQLETLN